MALTIADGARLLKVPEDEVALVEDSPAGTIVTTTDGARYVHADEPDADGKTGLMFLVAPSPNYHGPFPVYTQPGPAPAENVKDPERPDDPGTVVPEGNEATVLRWVGKDPTRARQAADYEASKDNPRSALVRKLRSLAKS